MKPIRPDKKENKTNLINRGSELLAEKQSVNQIKR